MSVLGFLLGTIQVVPGDASAWEIQDVQIGRRKARTALMWDPQDKRLLYEKTGAPVWLTT